MDLPTINLTNLIAFYDKATGFVDEKGGIDAIGKERLSTVSNSVLVFRMLQSGWIDKQMYKNLSEKLY